MPESCLAAGKFRPSHECSQPGLCIRQVWKRLFFQCAGALNGGGRLSDADELGGSALRLLHQLANSTMAAEALARVAPPAVTTILAATR